MSATVGVKLSEKTRNRLRELGAIKDRSTHWLMKEAIERYLREEENFEKEKADDRLRWQRYLETGSHITHEEMTGWLEALAMQAAKEGAAE